MGSPRIKSKRFTGVYYRESQKWKHHGRPDRIYWINYPDQLTSKRRWERIGPASQGYNEQYAAGIRQQRLAKPESRPDKKLTVDHAVREYVSWAEAEDKETAREVNRYDLHMKAAFGALPLAVITPDMLTAHRNRLSKKLAPESVVKCFGFIRRCVNHSSWPGVNPFSVSRHTKFKLPRVQNQGLRFLTPDEAQLLLSELKRRSQQVHDQSLFSLKTGIRATEIFTVKGQDIQPDAGVVWFTDKQLKQRSYVKAPSDVIKALLSYGRKPDEYVFQARDGGRITKGISKSFKRAVEALKLNDGVTDKRNQVWFHTWRHTFASWLAHSGEVSIFELQKLMRHRDIKMTMRYIHLFPDTIEAKKQDVIERRLRSPRKPELKIVSGLGGS